MAATTSFRFSLSVDSKIDRQSSFFAIVEAKWHRFYVADNLIHSLSIFRCLLKSSENKSPDKHFPLDLCQQRNASPRLPPTQENLKTRANNES